MGDLEQLVYILFVGSVVVFSAYSQRMSLIQFHYLDTPILA